MDPILGPENLLKPASLKRASLVALPVAISHKASLKPNVALSATLIQKTCPNNENTVPKMGPPSVPSSLGPHAQLSKSTKDFHGPIFSGYQKRGKINSKGRPVQQTRTFAQLNKPYRVGTSCPSGRHKPQSFIETKRCASATLIQKTSKNEPKHGPKNGTAWRSHFLGPHAQLSKRTKEKHFHGPIFLGPSGGTKTWDRLAVPKRDRKIAKSTAKADPCNKQKMTCV